MLSKKTIRLLIILFIAILALLAAWRLWPAPAAKSFDGGRAFQDVQYQVALGPRLPGSEAHARAVDWMSASLKDAGWLVELQETTRMDHPIRNVIAKRGTSGPWIIIGAHYDSRMKADHDPDVSLRETPVPAANDGAAGVAVLLELARTLPKDLNKQVWLVMLDAEDQGGLPGWDWILGSQVLAESLTGKPDAVVIIDMIGDADLNVYQERNSDPQLTQQIWQAAADLGYAQQIIPQPKYQMLDDHIPFLQKGIPAVDMIDFDYKYWHTTQDTPDKVSPISMKIIGETLTKWLTASNK